MRSNKTSAYARGRRFEWRVKRHLEGEGYFVLRSPRSEGPADLVAIRRGEVLLVQCKTGSWISADSRDALLGLARSIGAKAVFVHRGKAPRYELIFEDLSQTCNDKGGRKPVRRYANDQCGNPGFE